MRSPSRMTRSGRSPACTGTICAPRNASTPHTAISDVAATLAAPAFSGRNGLRQDWRPRVVPLAGPEAEGRLQQPLGDHFVMLVVAQDEAAALLAQHRDVRRRAA